jgi:hypothetical protein
MPANPPKSEAKLAFGAKLAACERAMRRAGGAANVEFVCVPASLARQLEAGIPVERVWLSRVEGVELPELAIKRRADVEGMPRILGWSPVDFKGRRG